MRRTSVQPIAAALLLAVLFPLACSTDSGSPDQDPSASPDGPPTFQVDPTWPRELPNDWILGSITSVFVDDRDHVWITHLLETLTPEEIAAVQDPPIGECCVPAPVVIEFDPDGDVVQAWGDPATQDVSKFPRNSHGLFIDHNGFVWIGTYRHHRVMKFTRDGQHLMTLGRYDENGGNGNTELLGGPPASGSTPKPTRFSSPTATATGVSSSSTGKQASTCGTGEPTASHPTTRRNTTTPGARPTARPRPSSPPCTAWSARATA